MACYGPFDNFTQGLHHFSSLSLAPSWQACRKRGAVGALAPPPLKVLADQLTLSQPGGHIIPTSLWPGRIWELERMGNNCSPRFWKIRQPYSNQGEEADYAHHISIRPPEFQTFLRSWSWKTRTSLYVSKGSHITSEHLYGGGEARQTASAENH